MLAREARELIGAGAIRAVATGARRYALGGNALGVDVGAARDQGSIALCAGA